MTTPAERTRNTIQAGDFLTRLARDERLPDDVRQEARRLLRHYPTEHDVRLAGEIEEKAFQQILCSPVFSSSQPDEET